MKLLKIILIFLFLCLPCFSATYYVATNGLDTNPGTEAQPWQTIQRAMKYSFPIQYRNPGDIVYLRGGVYSGNTNGIDINTTIGIESGTSNAPITVAAYPGETPIVCNQTSPYRGVLLKGFNWFIFDGITYSNCYQSVWLENCTNIVFKNCTFGWMPTAGSGYANFQLWATSQKIIVSNCTFYGWGEISDTCNDHGVSISIGDEAGDVPMWYNLVVSNRFFYGGHDHFQLNSAYNVIRGNLFVNAPWIPTNSTCFMLASLGGEPAVTNMYGAYGNRHTKPGDAGTSQIDMRNVFEGNTFLYTGPPPDDYGAFGIELGTRRSIYRFNTISFSLAAGIFFNTSGTTSRSTSNAVYGNVLYGNGLSHIYGGEGMKDYSYGLSMSTYEGRRTNNFVVNNIIFRNLPENVDPNIYVYQQMRGNFTNNAIDPMFVSTNGLGYVYVDENLPDFRLQSGSPCIDAGVFLATITSSSGTGTSFTVDNSLYFSDGNQIVAGDTIQLEGQTATAVITSNDFENGVLTFEPALTWVTGQGVSLSYSGTAPDIGAFEFSDPAPNNNSASATTVNVGTIIISP